MVQVVVVVVVVVVAAAALLTAVSWHLFLCKTVTRTDRCNQRAVVVTFGRVGATGAGARVLPSYGDM